MNAIVSDNLPLKRNVLLRSITSLITDCVAPYNIDVIFDALSDKGGAASNDITSCGKWNSLDNLLFNENLKITYVIAWMIYY